MPDAVEVLSGDGSGGCLDVFGMVDCEGGWGVLSRSGWRYWIVILVRGIILRVFITYRMNVHKK